jgi:hypothetical protein
MPKLQRSPASHPPQLGSPSAVELAIHNCPLSDCQQAANKRAALLEQIDELRTRGEHLLAVVAGQRMAEEESLAAYAKHAQREALRADRAEDALALARQQLAEARLREQQRAEAAALAARHHATAQRQLLSLLQEQAEAHAQRLSDFAATDEVADKAAMRHAGVPIRAIQRRPHPVCQSCNRNFSMAMRTSLQLQLSAAEP